MATATKGTVVGVFAGPQTTSLAYLLSAAFSDLSQRDLLQVVDGNGNVIFNVDYTGTANVNPTSPTPTATIGRFKGVLATINGNPNCPQAWTNPANLDLFHVHQPGGSVAYWLDYTGSVQTNGVS